MKTILIILIIIAAVVIVTLIVFFLIKKSKDPRKVWQKIYEECFGIKKDFSNLKIPKHYNPKKHFLIIVAQGLTMNSIIIAMRKKFSIVLRIENPDEDVNPNDRTAEGGDYIVLFNRNVEADKEFKKLSACQLETMNHQGITLMERLLLEALYFSETQQHLDNENVTLCAGSHYLDSNVPFVTWHSKDDKLRVDWCHSGFSGAYLRSRTVVS